MAVRAKLIPTLPPPEEKWPHHKAKWAAMPAHLLWKGDRRFEGESYLSDGYKFRLLITQKESGWKPFGQLASAHLPNRTKGIQVSEQDGVPYLTATQAFAVRPSPRKWLSVLKTDNTKNLEAKPKAIMVTRSGTVGRTMVVNNSTTGMLISDDLLRVQSNANELKGWIYAYLQSSQAKAMMTSSHYGQIIKHLETSHLDALPVPVVNDAIAKHFNKQLDKLLKLRNQAHEFTLEAEDLFAEALGSHGSCFASPETGFSVSSRHLRVPRIRLEASVHSPHAVLLKDFLKKNATHVQDLGDLGCSCWVPGRYKRVAAENGIHYFDSADILEHSPTSKKRFADCDFGDQHRGRVQKDWILIPSSGQVYGIIGTAVLAGETFHQQVVSNHVIRISCGENSSVRSGFLQTALAHPVYGRPIVKSLPFGHSVPEIHVPDLESFPVARFERQIEDKIADLADSASHFKCQADTLEREIAEEASELLDSFMDGDMTDFCAIMPAITDRPTLARPYGEHDCVRLAKPQASAGLAAESLGAIVHAYQDGQTYEVEFPDADSGHQVLTLTAADLKPA